VVPSPEFLPGLQEICRRHGIVTIADEIQTGCGRTGRFLASDHFGFEPDLVTLAKSLASGYPISAVVGRADVMDAPGDSALGGTYVGNPVACAAANAVLDVIEQEDLLGRADQVGKTIRARWEEIGRDLPEVGDIRGIGAMVGVELVDDPETKHPAKDFTARLLNDSIQAGVVAVNCGIYKNVLRHLLPLVITDEELAEGLDVLADAATAAHRHIGSAEEPAGEGE
jgi:4-aminobutyrate aminotransferase/(S)-3-amino-2-methylpropionate transaminase